MFRPVTEGAMTKQEVDKNKKAESRLSTGNGCCNPEDSAQHKDRLGSG